MPSGSRGLLAAAAFIAATFFALYVLAYDWHLGGQIDNRSLVGFGVIGVPLVTDVAQIVQSLCQPGPYLAISATLLIVVAIERGPMLAGAIIVLLLAANASTRVLKPALAAASGIHTGPISTVGIGSFPSGHSTAAMALACALVIAAPPAWRSVSAAAGGLFVLILSWSILVLDFHLPSDVIGGWLVATFWALVVIAGRAILPARANAASQTRAASNSGVTRWSLMAVGGTLAGIGALAGIVALVRLRQTAGGIVSSTDFGLVVVVLAWVLAALVCGIFAFASGEPMGRVSQRPARRPG
jgi:membrane-associated phospholipid phosphatase